MVAGWYLFLHMLSETFGAKKCEAVQEWKVKDYKIIKSRCPDLVLAHYYKYDIYLNDQRQGNVTQVDTCEFTWKAENERFLTLNTCYNSIEEIRPKKMLMDTESIDSVEIFSNQYKQTQLLTRAQIKTFVRDWNNSKARGYFNEPFDSAFYRFPAYQYKLTVFSKGAKRPFYGYNYLVLDSSSWEFEMSKEHDLKYIHSYWKK